jgi:hypothetical protein
MPVEAARLSLFGANSYALRPTGPPRPEVVLRLRMVIMARENKATPDPVELGSERRKREPWWWAETERPESSVVLSGSSRAARSSFSRGETRYPSSRPSIGDEQRSYSLNTKALTTCPCFQPWSVREDPSLRIFPMYAIRMVLPENCH